MIKAVMIINIHGYPRLTKFFQYYPEDEQQKIIKEIYHSISERDDDACNILEVGTLVGSSDFKLVYRHYATLYFVFCIDSSENELGILDLIQVFVESLDKCFENVCELDLIFHVDKVHFILNEVLMGGLVLSTNMSDIVEAYNEQNKIEKKESGIATASLHVASKVSSGLSRTLKDIKMPDLTKIPDLPNLRKS